MFEVRIATSEDVEWIRDVASVRMLVEEVGAPQYVNPTRIEELIYLGIANQSMWVVLKNDVLIGALGALAVPNVYNPAIRCLAEMFWWVDPDYRTGRAGLLLLNAFIEETSKYDEATLSLLTTSLVMEQSLNKRGFRLSEFGFKKG